MNDKTTTFYASWHTKPYVYQVFVRSFCASNTIAAL